MESTAALFKRLLLDALNTTAGLTLTEDDIIIGNFYSDTTHHPEANTAVVVTINVTTTSIYRGSKIVYFTRRELDGNEYGHYFEIDPTKPFFTNSHADELTNRTGIQFGPEHIKNVLTDKNAEYLGKWDFELNGNHELFIGKYPLTTRGRYPVVIKGVCKLGSDEIELNDNPSYPPIVIADDEVLSWANNILGYPTEPGDYKVVYSGLTGESFLGLDALTSLTGCGSFFETPGISLALENTALVYIGSNLSQGQWLTIDHFFGLEQLVSVDEGWGDGELVRLADDGPGLLFGGCVRLVTLGRFRSPGSNYPAPSTKPLALIDSSPRLKTCNLVYRDFTTSNEFSDLFITVGTDTTTGTELHKELLKGVSSTVIPSFIINSKIARLPADWFGLDLSAVTLIDKPVSGRIGVVENDLLAGLTKLETVRGLIYGDANELTTPIKLPPNLFRGAAATLKTLENVFIQLSITELFSTTFHGVSPTRIIQLFSYCDFNASVKESMWSINHTEHIDTDGLFTHCTFTTLPVGNSVVPNHNGTIALPRMFVGCSIRDNKLPSGFLADLKITNLEYGFSELNGSTETVSVPNNFFTDAAHIENLRSVFSKTRVSFSGGRVFPDIESLAEACRECYFVGPLGDMLAGCVSTKSLEGLFSKATFTDVNDNTFLDCANVTNIDNLCYQAVFEAQPSANWLVGLTGVVRAESIFGYTTVTIPSGLFQPLTGLQEMVRCFIGSNVRCEENLFYGLPMTSITGCFTDATVRGSLFNLLSLNTAVSTIDCTQLFEGTRFVNLSHGVMHIPANAKMDRMFYNSTNTRTLTVYEFCEWCGFGGDNVRSVDSVPADWLVGVKWVQGSLVDLLTILLGHVPTEEELDKWKPSVLGSGIA